MKKSISRMSHLSATLIRILTQTVVGGNDDGGGEHANRLAASEARAKVRGGNTDGPTGVCCGLLLIHQKGFPHPSYTQEAF